LIYGSDIEIGRGTVFVFETQHVAFVNSRYDYTNPLTLLVNLLMLYAPLFARIEPGMSHGVNMRRIRCFLRLSELSEGLRVIIWREDDGTIGEISSGSGQGPGRSCL